MASIFKDIFLSKKEKQIVEIYNTINNYWKNTNDFVLAHNRYLQDLNHRFKLEFSNELIIDLPYSILTPLIGIGLSQDNSMFIFSQFIGLYVFRFDNPTVYRYSNENLLEIAKRINEILIPYKSRVTPEFSYQINKDLDVISIFGNKNIQKASPERSEKNREFSKNILASRNNCSPNMLKQKIFEQYDLMDPTIEAIEAVMIKYNKTRFEHAQQYKIHPDDTPAALFFEMAEEYLEVLKTKKKSSDQI